MVKRQKQADPAGAETGLPAITGIRYDETWLPASDRQFALQIQI